MTILDRPVETSEWVRVLGAFLPDITRRSDIVVTRYPAHLRVSARPSTSVGRPADAGVGGDFMNGLFVRDVELPANTGEIKACYRDGLLEIWLRVRPLGEPYDVAVDWS